ncbi:hypothetical protein CGLO_13922 [Colletotrichum gloeosporioides Cg-14]|uniref:Uncharacterized protein n=1 Tax=Colletotrichum gloeosporioides (strain Cg-14) TaxID=1237896 RepID=T0K2P8_COLGC|nr:hypothetical protein CGLO_13922 [Colletotrichum gloeosporioides Cg-14]
MLIATGLGGYAVNSN